MNAKEVQDIYASFFRRVPNARPKPHPDAIFGLEYIKGEESRDLEEGWYWRDNGGWLIMDSRPDDVSIAALCRVAVEDWLLKQIHEKEYEFSVSSGDWGIDIITRIATGGGIVNIREPTTSIPVLSPDTGKPLHKAIVKIAHSVADNLGIPKCNLQDPT